MMTEELAAVGIPPVEQETREPEITQPAEDNTSPGVSGSENCEDGEIRLEGEDIGDVDADLRDLVSAKRSKALPPSFVFGESKVTANLIREYEATGFFPQAAAALPWMNKFLLPKPTKLLYFVTSSLVS
jgi:hypothetical protein